VPTNLKSKLKPIVYLKPHESCHALKRHVKGDNVLREVIGAWENQLRKYPNDENFLGVDVPWTVARTVKGPQKNVSFKDRISHSRWMVEEAYLAARELGIVSRPFETEIEGHGVKRGFVLTPHDALCQRTATGCLFVGPCEIPGTSWRTEMLFTAEKPNLKKSIVFAGFLEKGKDEGKEWGKEAGKENGVTSGQGNSPDETAEMAGDRRQIDRIPQSNSVHSFDSCESSESPYSCKTDETRDFETVSHGDAYGDQEKSKCEVKTDLSLSTSSHSLTHKPNQSIASHFESCNDVVLLVTDGLVARPSEQSDSGVKVAAHDAKYWEHQSLCNSVSKAVREMGDQPLVDRKTLAAVMNRAIAIHGGRVPKHIFKVMKDFSEQGGKITMVPPPPPPPPEKWTEAWLESQAVNSFRAAWQKFASEAPREKLDEWYDRDPMPDKPPAPWRS
jgi:hypothetical protein